MNRDSRRMRMNLESSSRGLICEIGILMRCIAKPFLLLEHTNRLARTIHGLCTSGPAPWAECSTRGNALAFGLFPKVIRIKLRNKNRLSRNPDLVVYHQLRQSFAAILDLRVSICNLQLVRTIKPGNNIKSRFLSILAGPASVIYQNPLRGLDE